MQEVSFLDRYAIVTGGGSGLGRETCNVLAQEGYRVAIVGIHRDGLEETQRMTGDFGQVEICDVTDLAAWQALRERLKSKWPRLDILVNNAGMFSSGFVGRQDLGEVERVLRLNLMGTIYGCETMVPWLIDSAKRPSKLARSRVVNVSSIYAYLSPPGMSAYNISKAGIVSLSETLRGELEPHSIGVTVVCPGPMATRFIQNAHFESPAFRQMTEQVVRDSTLQARDVAVAIRQAIYRDEFYCTMGTRERWYWRLKRLFPNTLLKRVAHRVRRDLKNPSS